MTSATDSQTHSVHTLCDLHCPAPLSEACVCPPLVIFKIHTDSVTAVMTAFTFSLSQSRGALLLLLWQPSLP